MSEACTLVGADNGDCTWSVGEGEIGYCGILLGDSHTDAYAWLYVTPECDGDDSYRETLTCPL